MKKITFLCAGLLLLLSFSVFAKEHLEEAMEHANAAAVHGEAGETAIMIVHAKAALEQVLEASIVAKGVAKHHLDDAAKELQESIELANLGHIGSATLHAETAVKHINISSKYVHPSVIIIKPHE
jgi:HEPN domain-containing protein